MSANTSFVIGIDGGGTKTLARLADLQGTVVAESLGGPSNFQIIGVEQASKNILDLIETCCHSVGCSNSEIGSVVAGLSGAGRAVDEHRMDEGLRNAAQNRGIFFKNLKIESDARVALEGAFLGKRGIVVISGTGSVVFAKDDKGKIHRAGGWGRHIGDEGSGYYLGREAFRSVARMMDGRGRKTRLAKMLGTTFGLKTHEDIIKKVYKEEFDLASVAPLVLRAGQQGDAVAKEILEAGTRELVDAVRAVCDKLKMSARGGEKKIPLVFMGGLLDSKNIYSKGLKNQIRKNLRNIVIEKPSARPVDGAVLMAIARIKH
jgi:N-acetylglucosamine kinase-like BadF-type ATPase